LTDTTDGRLRLFMLANNLLRQSQYIPAGLLFEHLALVEPRFGPYQHNAAFAKAKLGVASKHTLHFAHASDLKRRLRIAHVLAQLGLYDDARACLGMVDETHPPADALLCLAHVARMQGEAETVWLGWLNRYLALYDLPPLALGPAGPGAGGVFARLQAPQLPKVDGPLVSVCMACYNAEHTVERAVQSVLGQTHHNLELWLVNDASTDGTWPLLQRLAQQDGRIKLLNQAHNQGPYAARNRVLQQANGEFFAIMDADDWALPQRLELQVRHLRLKPSVAVLTHWVRMDADGRVTLRSTMGGLYQHEAAATLMVNRAQALESVGYWDAVRFAADTEYIFRLRKRLGDAAVASMGVPTVLALQHAGSLTSNPQTGIDTISVGNSPVRSRYKKAWQQWHQKTPGDELYLPFPQQSRQFDAPTEMRLEPHG